MTDQRFPLYDPEGRGKFLTAQERDTFLRASETAPRGIPLNDSAGQGGGETFDAALDLGLGEGGVPEQQPLPARRA